MRTVAAVFRNHRNPARPRLRALCGVLAVLSWTGAVVVAVHGPAAAVVAAVVCTLAPDTPLLLSGNRDFMAGRFHPRSVPAYNATHVVTGPVVVLIVAALTDSTVLAAAGAAWLAHVLTDRSLGYGLRSPDGWQDPTDRGDSHDNHQSEAVRRPDRSGSRRRTPRSSG